MTGDEAFLAMAHVTSLLPGVGFRRESKPNSENHIFATSHGYEFQLTNSHSGGDFCPGRMGNMYYPLGDGAQLGLMGS